MPIGYAVVASGQTVSAPFAVRGPFSVWLPPLPTCSMSLLGSFDTTSANFVPVYDPVTRTNSFLVGVGSGNRVIPVGDVGLQNIKVQLSAATTDNRTLAVLSR